MLTVTHGRKLALYEIVHCVPCGVSNFRLRADGEGQITQMDYLVPTQHDPIQQRSDIFVFRVHLSCLCVVHNWSLVLEAWNLGSRGLA